MSYWSPSETGGILINWDLLFFGNAQTPMLHDILTIQQKYGADETTRTGDTVYGYNSTADRDVFDFSQNNYPGLAIYDAGGEDTLDFSGFFGGSVINLNDGQFSSGGEGAPSAAEINANRVELFETTGLTSGAVTDASVQATLAAYQDRAETAILNDFGYDGVLATQYNNIAIAYGTEIENAVGSDYRDIIVTNEQDNILTGGLGDDVFIIQDGSNYAAGESFGNGGNDTITDFEVGSDVLDLSYLGLGTDSVLDFDGNVLAIDIDGDGAVDQSVTFENLDFVPVADIFA
ncbi:M10 family metallopeptidase C-terminal domain-containing protein [Aurantiacibacter poecillastricola]|uniref:M10 family metallopeptidase C-terminal domain-containing protein n=1 Tax=Aurantiacibacter poecillastricola TaxID=3064385 RepID=UPI00273E5C06|nr:M10 family metallopeptidase C-terminal domain-containing protein [Aurantiacibacter sp. 219JJ12-13]MDP5262151.1 M10 family metallopeptidase C-terminal domain-containing protein [Aurantiacibacter sp. 219JJ12-13]